MLELKLKQTIDFEVDGSSLSPERLAAIPLAELMSLPIPTQPARAVRLDDLFWVQWHDGPRDAMIIRGDCSRIHSLGSRMTTGSLVIDGAAGDRLGSGLAGGTILVAGSAGEEVAMGMRGGLIAIDGQCGDALAAPEPGQRSGMRGGDILVSGDVGSRACHRMRRGTVWIAGNAGDCLAPHLIAGTVLVHGQPGPQWGMGMRRGSLVFAAVPAIASGAHLSPSRSLELSFLPLVWSHLRSLQQRLETLNELHGQRLWNTVPLPTTRWVERRIGDLSVGGQGEVLVLQRLSSTAPPSDCSFHENTSPRV